LVAWAARDFGAKPVGLFLGEGVGDTFFVVENERGKAEERRIHLAERIAAEGPWVASKGASESRFAGKSRRSRETVGG